MVIPPLCQLVHICVSKLIYSLACGFHLEKEAYIVHVTFLPGQIRNISYLIYPKIASSTLSSVTTLQLYAFSYYPSQQFIPSLTQDYTPTVYNLHFLCIPSYFSYLNNFYPKKMILNMICYTKLDLFSHLVLTKYRTFLHVSHLIQIIY